MEIYSNNHSVFNLHYHLILVIKYRKQVISDSISNRLKDIFCYVSKNYHIDLEEWNHDIDHVHILFRSHPNTNISKFINAYKSCSSRLIKKEYPSIKEKLYKEAKKYLNDINMYKYELKDAINICKKAYSDRVILIVGSFYVYKTVCEVLKND